MKGPWQPERGSKGALIPRGSPGPEGQQPPRALRAGRPGGIPPAGRLAGPQRASSQRPPSTHQTPTSAMPMR
eukprot:8889671-Pyramimonas_sp.AAC.1